MAQRLGEGLPIAGFLRSPFKPEEPRPGPARAGYHTGNFGERLVAPSAVDHAIVEHGGSVAGSVPLPDQYRSGAGLPTRRKTRLARRAILPNPFEQAPS